MTAQRPVRTDAGPLPGTPRRGHVSGMGALETVRDTRSSVRVLNVLLGAWLFASAFLWPHHDNEAFNDWLCGLVVSASALCAIWAPPFRWVNAGVAAWLGFSAAVIFDYASRLTRIHDLAVAGLMFVIAMARWRTAPTAEPQVFRA